MSLERHGRGESQASRDVNLITQTHWIINWVVCNTVTIRFCSLFVSDGNLSTCQSGGRTDCQTNVTIHRSEELEASSRDDFQWALYLSYFIFIHIFMFRFITSLFFDWVHKQLKEQLLSDSSITCGVLSLLCLWGKCAEAGLSDHVLAWFSFYESQIAYILNMALLKEAFSDLFSFSLDKLELWNSYHVNWHVHTADTQYISVAPNDLDALRVPFACPSEMNIWMGKNLFKIKIRDNSFHGIQSSNRKLRSVLCCLVERKHKSNLSGYSDLNYIHIFKKVIKKPFSSYKYH